MSEEQFIPTAPPKGSTPKCGAKLRGKSATCQRYCLAGRNRCALHGGKSLVGADSATFKHGMYSKALPKHLKADFDKLMRDPALLDGSAEVSMLQLRTRQLAARLGTNESARTWATLRNLFAQFRAANGARPPDTVGMISALNAMQAIIDGAVSDESAWGELTEFIERATKVAEREWKRLVANQSMATAEQVRALVRSITEAVLLYVPDPTARLAIARHIDGLRVIEPLALGDGGEAP